MALIVYNFFITKKPKQTHKQTNIEYVTSFIGFKVMTKDITYIIKNKSAVSVIYSQSCTHHLTTNSSHILPW